ncbi:hypothetical protein OIDMADRAFT_33637 [Oidiodendron maius Zn]|uniref:Uncharacterized protein n=1 Tax=Oidiodendron maius (strain Zn) TaxID=913774 RepID=A0A0C3GHC1_OIDMZ|nr:hypothetical protein OIDMADRAFT_33637 [Oidiodendron maius Zn]
MHFWNFLKEKREHLYGSLPTEITPEGKTLENTHSYVPQKRNIWAGAALPWTLCAILLITLAIVSHRMESSAANTELGAFESGFVTEIGKSCAYVPVWSKANSDVGPARAAIKLKKKRFYGGEQIDGNGSYSLTINPDAPNYLAPPSPELDALWSKEMLHDGTLGFAMFLPEEITTSEIHTQEKDLFNGRYMGQPSTSHALHCLNSIRKSLAREYYTEIHDDPERPYHISHRMHMGMNSLLFAPAF